MRVIVEVFGRAWMLNLQSARVVDASDCEDEGVGHDPHGTLAAHIERGPGAECYTDDITARRFGFHGPESS